MKVKVWVEQEVEAEVSVEEAMAELCNMPTVESMQELMFVLNRCVGALRHCPDTMLAEMNPKSRQIVADALRQQALRYDPGLALIRGEIAEPSKVAADHAPQRSDSLPKESESGGAADGSERK